LRLGKVLTNGPNSTVEKKRGGECKTQSTDKRHERRVGDLSRRNYKGRARITGSRITFQEEGERGRMGHLGASSRLRPNGGGLGVKTRKSGGVRERSHRGAGI